jgi:hypothetical protein
MSTLKPRDKAILEKVFEMADGYVLGFSDRTMEAFFAEEFDIEVYGKKYDFDYPSRSKANRLRGILRAENDALVGNIILKLVDYAETTKLTRDEEITANQKELYQKAKDIGMQFLMIGVNGGENPLINELQDKSMLIKEFNKLDVTKLDKKAKIYILKVLFSYYEAAVTSYYGDGMFFVSSGIDDLNDYFKLLRRKMVEIIDADTVFDELKSSASYEHVLEQLNSLYGSSEYIDVTWDEYTRPAIINMRETIADLDLCENGCEMHKVGTAVQLLLEQVAKEITTLDGLMSSKRKTFYSPSNTSQSKSDTSSEVHHKHTVTFANNAQEKPIDLNFTQPATDTAMKTGFPYTIPDGTRWESIILTFLNDEYVKINVAGHTHETGFADMGFADGRKKGECNELWVLLRLLAQKAGSLPASDPDARDKYKQKKARLATALKTYFRFDTDPFKPYAKEKAYTLKMTIGYTDKPTQSPQAKTLTDEADDMFKSFSQ